MKHEFGEVYVLEAAAEDSDTWEEPRVDDAQDHPQPEFIDRSWRFRVIVILCRPRHGYHDDAEE